MENESVAAEPANFGALLRRYRLAAGLSQEALAERARVSAQGIGALERGDRRTPQRETLALLVAALGLERDRREAFEAAAARREAIPRPGRLVAEPGATPAPAFATLPHALTSFVGRDAEVAGIANLVREHRLVTLAGPGGIGKTRTAVEVATALAGELGGARIVEFAALQDASLLAATVATALGLPLSPNRPALETVTLHLQREHVLLVADNCEHVVDEAARVVTALLRACPKLHVLATSREPLRVSGEFTYRLPPLATPQLSDVTDIGEADAEQYPAITLFTERARAARQDFAPSRDTVAAVAEICARLDGIPLAIELAAARVAALPVGAIAETLRRRFALLAHGSRSAPTRHQTMHAAIEWSYDLLSAPERDLFEKLAIFAGGWSLAMLSEVCAAPETGDDETRELLSSLVDKSLVVADVSGDAVRYRLLDSFRHFALERLQSRADGRDIAHRHARAALRYAERCDAAFERESDAAVSALIRAELENVRAALDWSLRLRGDVVLGQRLTCGICPSLELIAPAEINAWLIMAFESIDAATPHDVVAKLDCWAVARTMAHGDYAASAAVALRSAVSLESIGDHAGAARATFVAGQALHYGGQYGEAMRLFTSALETARSVDALRIIGHVYIGLGRVHAALGDGRAARAAFEQASRTYERCGSAAGIGHAEDDLAEQAFREGDPEIALERVLRGLAIWRSRGDEFLASFSHNNAAAYLVALDRFPEAYGHASAALAIARKMKAATIPYALLHLTSVTALVPQTMVAGDARERLATAATLFGYIAECFRTQKIVHEYSERREFERVRTALERDTSPAERERWFARGSALTQDDACELAGRLEFAGA